MLVTGKKQINDQLGEFAEDLLSRLDELLATRGEFTVTVPPQEPPVVNIEPAPRPRSWIFKVSRDTLGRIEIITATPKF